jgi:APA family basic amino acid/polyamine antiporter
MLLALGIAAVVAYCNATSTAQLAAVHPESGGAYVYGRLRLGRWWGTVAGWAFVIGKTASCAAAALAIGAYVWPDHARWVAVLVVLTATAVDLAGIAKTATVTLVLVGVVLAVLAVAVGTAVLADGEATAPQSPSADVGPVGVLAAAALFFFAFAGYARVATLGAEVRDPARTIPRAILLALGGVLVVYVVVGLALLHSIGVAGLAGTVTPLSAAVDGVAVVETVVRSGAAVAAFAVLFPLLAGVSRTVFAMATYGDLPNPLTRVSARGVPHLAQLLIAVAVLLVVLTGGVVDAVAVSAGAVLIYYAIANAAALRLSAQDRRWPRGLAWLGLVGCMTLGTSLLTDSALM